MEKKKNKNKKDMADLTELSTRQIVDILRGAEENTEEYTVEEMGAELHERDIPDDDVSTSNTEYRGGIRPTHIPTH